jgi:glycosyltransferase involved in cell wall biosynthesis
MKTYTLSLLSFTLMKIAFIGMPWTPSVFPVPLGDSIALWTEAVAQRLCKIHKVVVYGCKTKVQPRVEWYGPIEYRRVSTIVDQRLLQPLLAQIYKRFNLDAPSLVASPFNYLTYGLQIALDLRQQACDIIHIQGFSQFVPIIRFFNPNLKIVLHAHAEWLVRFDRKLIAQQIQFADLILGCSHYLTKKHQQHFPEFSDRCRAVVNGVDIDRFSLPHRKEKGNRNIVFVGRVSPEKGVHTLIEAFNAIAQTDAIAQLTIIGSLYPLSRAHLSALSHDPKVRELEPLCDLDYVAYLKSLISPAAANRVHFIGSVEPAEVRRYLQESDLLVNPSFTETFGFSVVEAMAFELPVIAAQVGGMTDTVTPGETGLFFEAGNVSELEQALRSLLYDPAKSTEMGRLGRQRVLELYTWDEVVRQLLLKYDSLQTQPFLANTFVSF